MIDIMVCYGERGGGRGWAKGQSENVQTDLREEEQKVQIVRREE